MGLTPKTLKLRNGKCFPCFHNVMVTRLTEVWEQKVYTSCKDCLFVNKMIA